VKCIQDFGGKTRKKRPLGRPRHRWEGNIKMNLKDVMKWIHVAQDRQVAGFG
jgi:hypothetical protein